jgi:hypothetical protein
MATRTCPNCGTQYIATVRRCIDCDATLVDDVVPRSATEEVTVADDDDRRMVHLTLPNWGNQLKVTLEGMLDRQGIPRAWEAGDLVVPAARRDEVRDLIAAVEGSETPELAEDATMVALEIEGLDAAGLEELDGRLLATSVAHAWTDDGELLVAEADEEQVLILIQEVFDEEVADPGFDSAEALTTLYLATDRMVKRIGDRKTETTFVQAARRVAGIEVPYGLDGAAWRRLVADAADLAGQLDRWDAADDDNSGGDDSGDADAAEDEAAEDGAAEPSPNVVAVTEVDAEDADADADDDADADADADAEGDPAEDTPFDEGRVRTALVHLRSRLQDLV